MRFFFVGLTFLLVASTATATLSTIFPFFFPSRTTPRPTSVAPATNTIRRAFTRRTDFFGKHGKQKKTKLSLQVSLGPMIFPESYDETTPMTKVNRPTKVKPKFRSKTTTTTTESPDYEEYHESEEEILSEGYNPPTTTTPKPNSLNFLQQFKDRFPKIHDWLYDDQQGESSQSVTNRTPGMPKTFFTHKKKKHLKHKAKTQHAKHKKPSKYISVPPKKLTPPRRPPSTPRPTAPAFEQEEDIQAAGFMAPPPRPRPPKRKRPPSVIYEQYPAQQMAQFESEHEILPAGQPPRPTSGYIYPKPTEISREIFFYEPPQQFAPSKPKPYVPKPLLPPKKQIKVIFIKAPEPEPPVIPNIPQLQPAPEQKTLIYVVAKKPDEPPNITISAPVEPSTEKPGVFYVRYKVTTTTPVPDENEMEVLPGGFKPTPKPRPGYKYPRPKPTTTTTPPPDESEEEVLPGGQEPPDEYLPPDEDEEEILPGGQEPTEPPDEYLPPIDEQEEEILPGGQEPTKPPKEYLPATSEPPPKDEKEEEVLPGGQLPPPTPSPSYIPQPPPDSYYPPPKPYPANYYLPLPPQQQSYGQSLPATSWQGPNYGYTSPNVATNYGAQPQPYGSQYSSTKANAYGQQSTGWSAPATNYNLPSSNYGYQSYANHGTATYGDNNPKKLYGNSHYGNHYQKPEYSSSQYTPKNIHTLQPPRQFNFNLPLRYNEQTLHRQGEFDDDASLNSILFQSLGLSPFP